MTTDWSGKTIYVPSQQELLIGQEATAGTAVTTGLVRDGCRSIGSPGLVRSTEEENNYFGTSLSLVDIVDMARHGELSFVMPLRLTGWANTGGLAAMFGNGARAGSAPTYTFSPVTSTTRCPSFTIYFNTGDAANLLQFSMAQIVSAHLVVPSPRGNAYVEFQMMSKYPALVARSTLTVSTYVGSSAGTKGTVVRPFDGSYSYLSSSGNNYFSTERITAFDMTLTRPGEPEEVMDSKDIADLVLGDLRVAGNFSALFGGFAAAKIYNDWYTYVRIGTTSAKHFFVFNDPDGALLSLSAWPAVLTGASRDDSGQGIKVTGSFAPVNDFATANAATSASTILAMATTLLASGPCYVS